MLWEQGAVYTRSWVVDFILDLAGYVPERDLVDMTLVEPACGDGEFLERIVRRLSESCSYHRRNLRECGGSILAVDVDPEAVNASRARVERVLVECGQDVEHARQISRAWVRQADFLLDIELEMELRAGGGADIIVGNPPYVRLESISSEVAEKYRGICRTMTHRADLYVGFYERALELLGESGVCTFICADRWMLNQYGSALRKLITTGGFAVEAVVEMHGANAFRDEVLAYPAITSIRSGRQGRVMVARVGSASSEAVFGELVEAARRAQDRESATAPVRSAQGDAEYVIADEWFSGSDPWPSASPERLQLLKRLEAEFPPLQSETTRVGIGVATGADSVFITRDSELVESERLLPMTKVRDTFSGALEWSGEYLVNPWEESGLVDLEHYPRLRRYFEQHESVLKNRHVAKKNPQRWYRTIDKVNSGLVDKEKLLIPDIKGYAHPVHDAGSFYPHHNLYYVVSEAWDLKVLGGLLLSRVGQFFIECYAVRMNGGYLRFQAQYLRRIRVPDPHKITEDQVRELKLAFEERDVEAATAAALEVYGIDRIPE